MTEATIILPPRRRLTGTLVEHLGKGQVAIEVGGERFEGEDLDHWLRRLSRAR